MIALSPLAEGSYLVSNTGEVRSTLYPLDILSRLMLRLTTDIFHTILNIPDNKIILALFSGYSITILALIIY
jgi:hypothetical protein